jgi:ATP-dependent RNA helicase RhlE
VSLRKEKTTIKFFDEKTKIGDGAFQEKTRRKNKKINLGGPGITKEKNTWIC